MALFRRRDKFAHLPPPPSDEQRFSSPQVLAFLNAFTSYGGNYTTATLDQALRVSAFWACLRVLAGSVSTLPVDVVKSDGGVRTPMPAPSLIREPSANVTLDVWLHQMVTSMFDDGNAFGYITGLDRDNHPTFIETIAPADVSLRDVHNGVASVVVNGEREKLFPLGPIFHVPGPLVLAGSPFGLSPRAFATNALDATTAAQKFGTAFLDGGAVPSAILQPTIAGTNPTQPQADAVKAAFKRAAAGHDLAVIGADWAYNKIQVDPEESQFLGVQEAVVLDVCRYMGVPPTMVYAAISGQNVTYANASQNDLAYLKHHLEVPLTRLENALSRCVPRGQSVRFNRNALLRSDALTRWQVLDKRLRNKSMAVDEARALEDEPPFGGEYAEPGIPGGPTDDGAEPDDQPQEGDQ